MTMLGKVARALGRISMDSWINLMTGVGGGVNRNAFLFEADARIPDVTLQHLYDGDAFAARICDGVPRHALRNGFKVATGDDALDTALAAKFEELGAQEKLVQVWTWARLFGGAVLWIGADDGKAPDEPLDPLAVKSVPFVTVLDKREVIPETYFNDPMKGTFGEPETYRFARASSGGGTDNRKVHASRLIRFDGVMTTRERRREHLMWCDSVLQRTYDKLRQFNGAYAAVGTLLQDASQGVFKIKDLYAMMAGDAKEKLKQRMELMDMARSAARAILIDADGESFERTEVGALSGLPDVMDKFLLQLAGASETPVTVLMGQSPAGMNATGESDLSIWDAGVQAERRNMLAPRILKLARLLLHGYDVPNLKVEFPALREPTPSEKADLRLKVAQTDQIYLDKGVITAEEVAKSRFRPEGWSDETTIDQGDREAAMAADRAAAQAQSTQQTPPPAPGGAPTTNGASP